MWTNICKNEAARIYNNPKSKFGRISTVCPVWIEATYELPTTRSMTTRMGKNVTCSPNIIQYSRSFSEQTTVDNF